MGRGWEDWTPVSQVSQSNPAMALHKESATEGLQLVDLISFVLSLPPPLSMRSLGARASRRPARRCSPREEGLLRQTVNKTAAGGRPARCYPHWRPARTRGGGTLLLTFSKPGFSKEEEAERSPRPDPIVIGRRGEEGLSARVGCDQSREGDARMGRLWPKGIGKPNPKIARKGEFSLAGT